MTEKESKRIAEEAKKAAEAEKVKKLVKLVQGYIGLARSRTHSYDDAEDVIQLACIRLYPRYLDDDKLYIRENGTSGPWAKAIARTVKNLTKDNYRKHNRDQANFKSSQLVIPIANYDLPDILAIRHENIDRVHSARGQLDAEFDQRLENGELRAYYLYQCWITNRSIHRPPGLSLSELEDSMPSWKPVSVPFPMKRNSISDALKEFEEFKLNPLLAKMKLDDLSLHEIASSRPSYIDFFADPNPVRDTQLGKDMNGGTP